MYKSEVRIEQGSKTKTNKNIKCFSFETYSFQLVFIQWFQWHTGCWCHFTQSILLNAKVNQWIYQNQFPATSTWYTPIQWKGTNSTTEKAYSIGRMSMMWCCHCQYRIYVWEFFCVLSNRIQIFVMFNEKIATATVAHS